MITPVMNGAAFLPRCLESVRLVAQLVSGRIEHIIADGGSSDGSAELAQTALDDPASPVVRVIRGPDEGQSDAINTAAAEANGLFVGWLNADDTYRPEAMARLLSEMASVRESVIVARCSFVDRSGRVLYSPRPPEPITLEPMLRLLTSWFAGESLVQPEVFIRSDVWRQLGGLNEQNHHSMDHEFWIRICEAGHQFASVDLLVAEQLVHAGQKTADNEAVVRSMLPHVREAIASDPRRFARAESELGIIEQRLQRLSGVRSEQHAAVTRLVRGFGDPSRVLPAVRHSETINAILHDRKAWKCEPSIWLDCLPPSASIRAHSHRGSLPHLGASFDLVVAHAPTLRYGIHAWARLASWLKTGGLAVLLDEPVRDAAARRLNTFNQTIEDSLTLQPTRSVLDTPRDEPTRWVLRILGAAADLADRPEPRGVRITAFGETDMRSRMRSRMRARLEGYAWRSVLGPVPLVQSLVFKRL